MVNGAPLGQRKGFKANHALGKRGEDDLRPVRAHNGWVIGDNGKENGNYRDYRGYIGITRYIWDIWG